MPRLIIYKGKYPKFEELTDFNRLFTRGGHLADSEGLKRYVFAHTHRDVSSGDDHNYFPLAIYPWIPEWMDVRKAITAQLRKSARNNPIMRQYLEFYERFQTPEHGIEFTEDMIKNNTALMYKIKEWADRVYNLYADFIANFERRFLHGWKGKSQTFEKILRKTFGEIEILDQVVFYTLNPICDWFDGGFEIYPFTIFETTPEKEFPSIKDALTSAYATAFEEIIHQAYFKFVKERLGDTVLTKDYRDYSSYGKCVSEAFIEVFRFLVNEWTYQVGKLEPLPWPRDFPFYPHLTPLSKKMIESLKKHKERTITGYNDRVVEAMLRDAITHKKEWSQS